MRPALKSASSTQNRSKPSPRANCHATRPTSSMAALIARFCRAHAPPAWTPPAPEMRELREMVRRCAALKAHRTQEINRQKAGLTSRVVATSIERLLTYIEQELRTITAAIRTLIARHSALQNNFDLLCSIPSIGEVTAALVLAELPNIAEFTPKGLAAFAGLSPQEHSSGTRRHTGSISRIGNPALRSTLYLCALSARAPQSAPRRFRATPDPGWKTSQGRPHRPRPQAAGHGTRRHPNQKTVRDGLITYPLTQTPP